MRYNRSLSGLWQFQLDPTGTLGVESLTPDREITVPLPWQAAFPELQQYSGYAWYRLSIDLDKAWPELGIAQEPSELLLRFGAVDYWCQVYFNGQLAGQHEGGYTPFTIPVGYLARPGRNEIAVRVYDPAQTHILIPRWPSNAPDRARLRPFGKTSQAPGGIPWAPDSSSYAPPRLRQ